MMSVSCFSGCMVGIDVEEEAGSFIFAAGGSERFEVSIWNDQVDIRIPWQQLPVAEIVSEERTVHYNRLHPQRSAPASKYTQKSGKYFVSLGRLHRAAEKPSIVTR
jgi:hypothetical protein